MGVVRKVKFEYYEVVSKKNSDPPQTPDRLFDLQRWIDKAEKLSLEGRTFDYYNERARLDKFEYDDSYDLWFLNFVRLRETNIPKRGRIDRELEPIELDDDEFIGEDVSMLYDPKLNIAMLQRNIYSLGPSGIQKYLNLLWANENNEEIFLRPIYSPNSFDRAFKKGMYKKITIRFAQVPKKLDNLQSPIKSIIESFGKYNGVTGEITINVWPAREGNLHRETIHETLNDIKENRDIFKKALISIKKEEDEPVEIIDLFEDKLYDYLTFSLEARQSLACEYVQEEMVRKYLERRAEILTLIKR